MPPSHALCGGARRDRPRSRTSHWSAMKRKRPGWPGSGMTAVACEKNVVAMSSSLPPTQGLPSERHSPIGDLRTLMWISTAGAAAPMQGLPRERHLPTSDLRALTWISTSGARDAHAGTAQQAPLAHQRPARPDVTRHGRCT